MERSWPGAIVVGRREGRWAPGEHELPAPSVPRSAVAGKVPNNLFTSRGGLAYVQFCGDCHRQDGNGVSKIFPPLAGNPAVTAKEPATLLHITLTGWKTAATAAHPRVFTMPGFARLNDRELAELTLTVGFYMMVSRFLENYEVDIEDA